VKLPLDILPEVRRAFAANRPVVALESTLITHGMPWPGNLETARAASDAVRGVGGVPATVLVEGGFLRIGLPAERVESLARDGVGVAKLSRADLAAYLATGRTGATTVAATMVAAHAAGIEVFATGGIGGVHAGAETSFDISADLHELARTPVAVVAAGAKAILDLPKTLELLETLGVPVIGHGTDVFPAFWSRESGLRAPLRADSPAEIAAILRTHGAIGGGGLLVANPVPAEHEVPAARLAPLIAQAQAEAVAEGVTGKAVTPWLLARLAALTEGRTLDANRALIVDNARLATRIAAELCRPF
jgi:pseudouridine-5'-phosphate glycosidase